MAKLVKYILIPIFFVFVMSHNASAANFSYNMNDYDWITSVNLGTQYCAYSYNTFGSSPSICILTKNQPKMFGIRSYDIPHEKGDLAEFYLGVESNINGASNYRNYGAFLQNFGAIDDNFKIIGMETVTDQKIVQDFFGGENCTYNVPGSNFDWECHTDSAARQTYYAYIVKITILYTTKGSHPVGIKALNANSPIITCKIDSLAGEGAQCQARIFGFTQWGYKGSSVNKEQKEAAEDAAADSQTSGSSSQNDATSATSSLISVITSGIGAITSASASNCVINADMGNLDMGSIDLCANPVPTFMQVIGSIIAALVVLPLVIVLFNRFIAIIGSFQR